ncbi:diguanylate cyclase [candidate division FCPU426 bacterium]|nr:diguanylate cyclase [candidate division FCPU426 bacterium]
MKSQFDLASLARQKKLLSLFNKIEKHKKSLAAEIEGYIRALPDTVIEAPNLRYLPAILEILFKEFNRFRLKLHKKRFASALKSFQQGARQLASTSRAFSIFVVVWTVLREMVRLRARAWFSARQLQNILDAGENFWTLGLCEITNTYLRYTDKIIREKTLESSVLFHTTQSITTDLDLESLLNKIVFHAGMLLQNKQMFLFAMDTKPASAQHESRLVLRASNQPGEAYGEYTLKYNEGPIGQVAVQRVPMIINHYYRAQTKLPFISNAAHLLIVPIAFSEELLGIMVAAEYKRTEPINDSDKELLLMYAQQIAITFKNVLLYLEATSVARELDAKNRELETQSELTLRRTAQMVVLNEISQKVNSSLDLKEVLVLLARQAAESIGLDRCLVWLFDDMKVHLEAAAACGVPNQLLNALRFPLAEIRDTVFFKTLSELAPVQVKGGYDAEMLTEKFKGQIVVNAMLVVPLLFKEEAIGFLAVDDTREAHEFLDDEVTLISAIANHTVMAIENARLYQKVKEQAITDSLTGLYNHRFFQLRFSDEFSHCKRYGNDLSLIILDIDHFKQYNDTYGHIAGDLALKEIANLTRASVRENDIVARYGGEEFTIILPMTNLEGAKVVAERIRKSVKECRFLGDLNVPQVSITISLGVSSFNREVESREVLFRQADAALYYAKEHGRDQITSYPWE